MCVGSCSSPIPPRSEEKASGSDQETAQGCSVCCSVVSV